MQLEVWKKAVDVFLPCLVLIEKSERKYRTGSRKGGGLEDWPCYIHFSFLFSLVSLCF